LAAGKPRAHRHQCSPLDQWHAVRKLDLNSGSGTPPLHRQGLQRGTGNPPPISAESNQLQVSAEVGNVGTVQQQSWLTITNLRAWPAHHRITFQIQEPNVKGFLGQSNNCGRHWRKVQLKKNVTITFSPLPQLGPATSPLQRCPQYLPVGDDPLTGLALPPPPNSSHRDNVLSFGKSRRLERKQRRPDP